MPTRIGDKISKLRSGFSGIIKESEDVVNDAERAFAEFREGADALRRVTKQVSSDAAELRAFAGEFTNGGPPLDESK